MAQQVPSTLQEQVLALPQEQRQALLEVLRESLAPMPDWHREVLDERIAAAEANPDAFTPAPEVVERVRARLRRR